MQGNSAIASSEWSHSILIINIGNFSKFQKLTHLFPTHPFSTPLKTSENLTGGGEGGRERVHWERMG